MYETTIFTVEDLTDAGKETYTKLKTMLATYAKEGTLSHVLPCNPQQWIFFGNWDILIIDDTKKVIKRDFGITKDTHSLVVHVRQNPESNTQTVEIYLETHDKTSRKYLSLLRGVGVQIVDAIQYEDSDEWIIIP